MEEAAPGIFCPLRRVARLAYYGILQEDALSPGEGRAQAQLYISKGRTRLWTESLADYPSAVGHTSARAAWLAFAYYDLGRFLTQPLY